MPYRKPGINEAIVFSVGLVLVFMIFLLMIYYMNGATLI